MNISKTEVMIRTQFTLYEVFLFYKNKYTPYATPIDRTEGFVPYHLGYSYRYKVCLLYSNKNTLYAQADQQPTRRREFSSRIG